MRYISWIFTIPLLAVLVLFALYNRDVVTIDILGIGVLFAVPVYILTYGAILFGFFVGGVALYIKKMTIVTPLLPKCMLHFRIPCR